MAHISSVAHQKSFSTVIEFKMLILAGKFVLPPWPVFLQETSNSYLEIVCQEHETHLMQLNSMSWCFCQGTALPLSCQVQHFCLISTPCRHLCCPASCLCPHLPPHPPSPSSATTPLLRPSPTSITPHCHPLLMPALSHMHWPAHIHALPHTHACPSHPLSFPHPMPVRVCRL